MSTFDIKMPKLGESITEGTIIRWAVKVGDPVKEDDILFEVTTAKVNAEVPCPLDGTVQELLFSEGDTIEVGVVVARILPEGEEAATDSGISAEAKEDSLTTTPEEKTSSAESKPETPKPEKENARWYSPVVSKISKEAGVSSDELDAIAGTGFEGRLSKNDLVNYIESKKAGLPTGSSAGAASISEKKLKPVAQVLPITQPEPVAAEVEAVDMDPVARIIAERMVQSKKISAHVTTVVEADVTKLVNWRNKNKDTFFKQEGIGLNYLPAIVEATTRALKVFPKLNASVDGNRFLLKKNINIGIAVALDDGNLIVPVIHGADKQSIRGLAHSIDTLAKKARSNKLKLEEIEGGTFTITNFGTFRNLFGTPIINQPEVAILGVGYVEKKPAVLETPEGDVIAIRHKMYLSLTYDHRIVNGAVGGAFLKEIADVLENWNPA
jgi:2-oxoglutarate dehydrogenase E2 component (dihydrolipoamide succinyltransferase)